MFSVIITAHRAIVNVNFDQKLVLFGTDMNYFNELKFISGGIYNNCSHPPIDNRFYSFYSLQYDRGGTIYYNITKTYFIT